MLFLHTEAFPLAMMLFGSKRFPWPAMGIVHLANSATLHQRVHAGDVVRIEMQTGELFKHEKGQVFTLHARALRDGQLVWDSTWTLLRMGVKQPQGAPYVSALGEMPPLSRQADFLRRVGHRAARMAWRRATSTPSTCRPSRPSSWAFVAPWRMACGPRPRP